MSINVNINICTCNEVTVQSVNVICGKFRSGIWHFPTIFFSGFFFRHLFGFYFDWDEIRDRMNVLTKAPLI